MPLHLRAEADGAHGGGVGRHSGVLMAAQLLTVGPSLLRPESCHTLECSSNCRPLQGASCSSVRLQASGGMPKQKHEYCGQRAGCALSQCFGMFRNLRNSKIDSQTELGSLQLTITACTARSLCCDRQLQLQNLQQARQCCCRRSEDSYINVLISLMAEPVVGLRWKAWC